MPKLETKGPLGFLEVRIIAKFQRKIEEGTFKNFQKNLTKQIKLKEGPFNLVRVRKCTKKFLAEGTRTCDRWSTSKPIKICTEKWYIQGSSVV